MFRECFLAGIQAQFHKGKGIIESSPSIFLCGMAMVAVLGAYLLGILVKRRKRR